MKNKNPTPAAIDTNATTANVIADKLGGGKVTLIGNLIANQFSSTAQNSYSVGSVLAIIMLLMIGLTTLISSIANDKKPVKRGGLF